MKDDELSAPIPIPDPKIKLDGRISVEQFGIGIAVYSVGMTLRGGAGVIYVIYSFT